MIVAAGWLAVVTRLLGRTVSVDGAAPNEQVSDAPLQTCWDMGNDLSLS
jgi:hypothetical protein